MNWSIKDIDPKALEKTHADCRKCGSSMWKDDILVCILKHADVTDRGILPCTHYESCEIAAKGKTPEDKEFLVTLNVTGTATIRLLAKDKDEAEENALDRIDDNTTAYDLEYEVEEVSEVKRG